MVASSKNLYIEQGATFSLGWIYYAPVIDPDTGDIELDANGDPIPGDPYSLAGCSARMQIRQRVSSTTALLTATTGDPDVYPDSGGRIILEAGGETGRIDIVLTDTDTDKLTVKKAYYDFELQWPAVDGELRPRVDRLLEGTVTVDLNVTRDDGTDSGGTSTGGSSYALKDLSDPETQAALKLAFEAFMATRPDTLGNLSDVTIPARPAPFGALYYSPNQGGWIADPEPAYPDAFASADPVGYLQLSTGEFLASSDDGAVAGLPIVVPYSTGGGNLGFAYEARGTAAVPGMPDDLLIPMYSWSAPGSGGVPAGDVYVGEQGGGLRVYDSNNEIIASTADMDFSGSEELVAADSSLPVTAFGFLPIMGADFTGTYADFLVYVGLNDYTMDPPPPTPVSLPTIFGDVAGYILKSTWTMYSDPYNPGAPRVPVITPVGLSDTEIGFTYNDNGSGMTGTPSDYYIPFYLPVGTPSGALMPTGTANLSGGQVLVYNNNSLIGYSDPDITTGSSELIPEPSTWAEVPWFGFDLLAESGTLQDFVTSLTIDNFNLVTRPAPTLPSAFGEIAGYMRNSDGAVISAPVASEGWIIPVITPYPITNTTIGFTYDANGWNGTGIPDFLFPIYVWTASPSPSASASASGSVNSPGPGGVRVRINTGGYIAETADLDFAGTEDLVPHPSPNADWFGFALIIDPSNTQTFEEFVGGVTIDNFEISVA